MTQRLLAVAAAAVRDAVRRATEAMPESPVDDAALRAALEKLPQDLRQLLEAYYFGDETLAEIAVRLGVNENTLRGRLSRARRHLQELLGIETQAKALELALVRLPRRPRGDGDGGDGGGPAELRVFATTLDARPFRRS
jgi:hypothetical protein